MNNEQREVLGRLLESQKWHQAKLDEIDSLPTSQESKDFLRRNFLAMKERTAAAIDGWPREWVAELNEHVSES